MILPLGGFLCLLSSRTPLITWEGQWIKPSRDRAQHLCNFDERKGYRWKLEVGAGTGIWVGIAATAVNE